MKQTIVPSAAPMTVGRRRGLVEQLARKTVIKRLGGLREGRLTLIDDEGAQSFGDGDAATGLVATVEVHHPRFYREVVLGGSLGAAEAYLRGDWSCDDLVSLCRIFARNLEAADGMETGTARLAAVAARAWHRLRRNTVRGSGLNIHAHYDLGNEFFQLFLDETMTYSCGVFEQPHSTLRDASIAKMDCVCRKLELTCNDHLLEIGTGWGSFALHAAGQYGCRVTTTTISEEQFALARQRIQAAGLEDRITLLQRDYRALEGRYDKLVSIEMIEAVGHEFLPTYFRKCSELLKENGMMLVQGIVMADYRYERYRRSVDFIQRYIFPGSCLPSLSAMCQAMAKATDLRLFHLDDITPHYAKTLHHWRARFFDKIDDVRRLGYPESFIRLWEYYLCYCEAGFEERHIGSVQMLLTKPRCRREPLLTSGVEAPAAA